MATHRSISIRGGTVYFTVDQINDPGHQLFPVQLPIDPRDQIEPMPPAPIITISKAELIQALALCRS